MDAVPAILAAFSRHPLVGLGEIHQNQQEHDLIIALLRAPGFVATVDDLVVECGNARYQDLVDRYTAGEPVAPAELRPAWRDITVPTPACGAPVYERLFATVRTVNLAQKSGRRLRILLGEPPIDWSQVRGPADHQRFFVQRVTYPARLIENEVLAKGRRALIIYGAWHLVRKAETLDPTLAATIEARHPGSLFLVWPHQPDAIGGKTSRLEPRLRSWPAPSLALVKGTWLGETVLTVPAIRVDGRRQRTVRLRFGRFDELVDAYLYLRPVRSLTQSEPKDLDAAYLRELQRREILSRPAP
jgi:hypothetical protein